MKIKIAQSFSSPRLTDEMGNKLVKQMNDLNEPWAMFVHITDLHEPIRIPNKFNKSQYGSNQYEKQIFAIDNKIGELLKNINLQKTQLVITADHGSYLKQMNIDEKNVNFEDNTGIRSSYKNKLVKKFQDF